MPAPLVLTNHGLRHSGGIERYLLTLVEGLHARGIRPTVVAHHFDRTLPAYRWVEPVRVRTGPLGNVWRDLWFDARVRALKARHDWFPVVGLVQTGSSDIAICGSTHPGYLEAMRFDARLRDRLAIGLERRHFGGARLVVAHSRLLAGQLERHHGVAPDRIRVLYPPVDTSRFAPVADERRAELRRRFGFPPDRAVFLLASTGHARKGLDLAVRALGHGSRPALLAVAGRPVDVQAPNLRYLGYRTDIEDVYRAADCTLLASRYEPFGLVGVESVLCGTPVVGERRVGCMEVLARHAAMAFDLDAPGSLDAAIDAALARWREGTLRLAGDPRAALGYDPSVDSHLDALLDAVAALRAERQIPSTR